MTMQAITFSKFGGPEVLSISRLPKPSATDGDVLVRVLASSLNPTDILMRDGRQAAFMKDLSPPYIAGVEFCGIVEDAPGSAVYSPGMLVMGLVNSRRHDGGSHAEFIRAPAASLAVVPAGVTPCEAATIPMNGLTAKLALETLELPLGSTILVTGAAGAAGGYAIELARQFGYRTVAVAREEDRALLNQLGANAFAPGGDAMTRVVRSGFPEGVDGLIDAALLGDVAASLVRDGGSAITLRSSAPITDPRLRTRFVAVFDHALDSGSLGWLAARVRATATNATRGVEASND